MVTGLKPLSLRRVFQEGEMINPQQLVLLAYEVQSFSQMPAHDIAAKVGEMVGEISTKQIDSILAAPRQCLQALQVAIGDKLSNSPTGFFPLDFKPSHPFSPRGFTTSLRPSNSLREKSPELRGTKMALINPPSLATVEKIPKPLAINNSVTFKWGRAKRVSGLSVP